MVMAGRDKTLLSRLWYHVSVVRSRGPIVFKTIFIISIITARVAFPGLAPTMGTKPDATTVPATRTVSFDLFCGRDPSAGSRASVYVPPGLNLGKMVRMHAGAAPDLPQPP